MKARRDRDYIKCPDCDYILALVRSKDRTGALDAMTRAALLAADPHAFEPVEVVIWKSGWRVTDGHLAFKRARRGRGDERQRFNQEFPDAVEAKCPRCYEVADLSGIL